MRSIADWIKKNKQWIFSGIGATILACFFSTNVYNKQDIRKIGNDFDNNNIAINIQGNDNVVYNDKNDHTQEAIQLLQDGMKYYNLSDYKNAINKFEQSYTIKRNLSELKYYYVRSLLNLNYDENFKKAYTILFENEDSLSDNELVMYLVLSNNIGTIDKSKMGLLLEKIEDPFALDDFCFNKYLEIYGVTQIARGMEEANAALYNISNMADKKINIFEIGEVNTIAVPYQEGINANVNDYSISAEAKTMQSVLFVYNYYLSLLELNNLNIPSNLLSKSSKYFGVFNTDETIINDYLDNLFDYVNNLEEMSADDKRNLILCTENILKVLCNNQKNYGRQYEKVDQIYKQLVSI